MIDSSFVVLLKITTHIPCPFSSSIVVCTAPSRCITATLLYVSSCLSSDRSIDLFRLHASIPSHRIVSATPAVSRTSVVWSVASLRPHRQPQEGPLPRPGPGLRGKRRPRSGRLSTSSRRNYFAASAQRAVEAPTVQNTGRWVMCYLDP